MKCDTPRLLAGAVLSVKGGIVVGDDNVVGGISHGIELTFDRKADLLFPACQLRGQGHIENEIHVPPSRNHPEIVKAQPGILTGKKLGAQVLQPGQLRIIGDDGIVMDYQMNIVAAQAFPFHVIDELMAQHGIFPAVHLHVKVAKRWPGP